MPSRSRGIGLNTADRRTCDVGDLASTLGLCSGFTSETQDLHSSAGGHGPLILSPVLLESTEGCGCRRRAVTYPAVPDSGAIRTWQWSGEEWSLLSVGVTDGVIRSLLSSQACCLRQVLRH